MGENNKNPDTDIILIIGELKGRIDEMDKRIQRIEEVVNRWDKYWKIIGAILMIIASLLGINIGGI